MTEAEKIMKRCQAGTKRREQIKQTEIPDYHPLQIKRKKK
jgi:hypothetical protein